MTAFSRSSNLGTSPTSPSHTSKTITSCLARYRRHPRPPRHPGHNPFPPPRWHPTVHTTSETAPPTPTSFRPGPRTIRRPTMCWLRQSTCANRLGRHIGFQVLGKGSDRPLSATGGTDLHTQLLWAGHRTGCNQEVSSVQLGGAVKTADDMATSSPRLLNTLSTYSTTPTRRKMAVLSIHPRSPSIVNGVMRCNSRRSLSCPQRFTVSHETT